MRQVKARYQFELILYATTICDKDEEYNPDYFEGINKKKATLCHKLQSHIYPFLEALEEEFALPKKCKVFLKIEGSLEKLKTILENAVAHWDNPSTKRWLIQSPQNYFYARKIYENKPGTHEADMMSQTKKRVRIIWVISDSILCSGHIKTVAPSLCR
jgi:hypothetical protein